MCAPSAPDTSGVNRAAEATAALSKEQLDWAKQLYSETAPERRARPRHVLRLSSKPTSTLG